MLCEKVQVLNRSDQLPVSAEAIFSYEANVIGCD